MPIQPTGKIWMDGQLVDWQEAKIHVLTHSLHYGTAVFEGIRAYSTDNGPAIFRLSEHVARLLNSAKLLSMDCPYTQEELEEAMILTVAESGLESGYIRPILYLGYGEMGLNPLPCKVNAAVAMWPWGAYLGDEAMATGISVMVSSWVRQDPRTLPTAAKATGMYINSSLAKVEALRAGYDEALLLNMDGYVSEGTGENIFLVKDGVLITPPSSAVGALNGITADSVKVLAHEMGHEVEEKLIRRADVYLADEAFLTGTAAEIVPIRELDNRKIGREMPGRITKQLREAYDACCRGSYGIHDEWITVVKR